MGPPAPPLEVGPPPPREMGPPLPLPEVVAATPPSGEPRPPRQMGPPLPLPEIAATPPSWKPQTAPASPGAPRPEAKPEARIEKWIGQFIWPVDGKVVSQFGIRDGRRHDGLDIAAPEGTSIRAAASGTVLYSGNQQTGYGNLIILHHAQDMITVYAHNKVNLVKDGEAVKQGQEIAKVGRSGRVTKFHLHFEVRKRTKPRNPQFFLPKPS